MKIQQLLNFETQHLEIDSYPISMCLCQLEKSYHDKWLLSILCWTHINKLDNRSIYQNWKKAEELLGHKKQYLVNYKYRNAVWGFKHKNIQFLVYISKSGLSLQIDNNLFKKSNRGFALEKKYIKQVEEIIDFLFWKLCGGRFVEFYYSKKDRA